MFAKTLCAVVVREEIHQFVAEDAGAAGLKEDKEQAGVDLRSKPDQNLAEIGASLLQESEVVERTAAADVMARDFDDETCGVQGLRMVVVVPRVGPEQYAALSG